MAEREKEPFLHVWSQGSNTRYVGHLPVPAKSNITAAPSSGRGQGRNKGKNFETCCQFIPDLTSSCNLGSSTQVPSSDLLHVGTNTCVLAKIYIQEAYATKSNTQSRWTVESRVKYTGHHWTYPYKSVWSLYLGKLNLRSWKSCCRLMYHHWRRFTYVFTTVARCWPVSCAFILQKAP
jgi:hypothetical protein